VKLHLVFEPSILTPLVQALHTQGYSVSGTDVTLEQFAIAANAKQIDADVAIVDGSLGVLRKQESVGWLKEVRMRIPDMRVIVVLPETDLDWQRSLGMYGIYDVYLAEQFRLEDVKYWIQTKKTLADVPQFHATVAGQKTEHKVGFSLEKNKGKIQTILADWTKGFKRADRRSGPTVETTPTSEEERLAEAQGTEDLEASSGTLEVQEAIAERTEHQPEQTPALHIPQPYIVAVGGLASRSGNTHTAIQIAYEIASQGIKTAFIEYRSKPKPSDIVSFATDFDGLQFHHQGIDFFPNRSPMDVAEIYTLEYEAIVLDLGVMVDELENRLELNSAAQEFLRAPFQYMTLSAAPWDLHFIVRNSSQLAMLMRKASLVINFADENMIKEFREMFPAVTSILNPLQANPFTSAGGLAHWLERPKEKRKRWFVH
jgi:hypothetical protein